MNVVGHYQIISDHPSISRLPGFDQSVVNLGISEERSLSLCADRQECDGRLIRKNENTFSWMVTSDMLSHDLWFRRLDGSLAPPAL